MTDRTSAAQGVRADFQPGGRAQVGDDALELSG
jgi:hypothetical protein